MVKSNAMKRFLTVLVVGVCCFVAAGADAKKRAKKEGYLNSGPSMKERYSNWGSRGARSEAVWLRKKLGDAFGRIEVLEKQLKKLKREIERLERERFELSAKLEESEAKRREAEEIVVVPVVRDGAVPEGEVETRDKIDTGSVEMERYFVKTRTYVVKEGDTLWSIAADEEIYGDPFRWIDIYNANKEDLDSTNKEVVQGMYLRIPREEDEPIINDDADTSAGNDNEEISKAKRVSR